MWYIFVFVTWFTSIYSLLFKTYARGNFLLKSLEQGFILENIYHSVDISNLVKAVVVSTFFWSS